MLSTPLGRPVEPEVNRILAGVSAPMSPAPLGHRRIDRAIRQRREGKAAPASTVTRRAPRAAARSSAAPYSPRVLREDQPRIGDVERMVEPREISGPELPESE